MGRSDRVGTTRNELDPARRSRAEARATGDGKGVTRAARLVENPLYASIALPLSGGVLVKKAIDPPDVNAAIDRLAEAIARAHPSPDRLVLAAIANGGVPLCALLEKKLSARFARSIPQAIVDVSFHRDDIGQKPITKEVQATHMVDDPEDSTVILVDDVLFSGRTVRAAIAEVLTIGRPYQVELAVLVDRGNRRLPIAANYVGLTEDTSPDEKVEVTLDPANPAQSRIQILEP